MTKIYYGIIVNSDFYIEKQAYIYFDSLQENGIIDNQYETWSKEQLLREYIKEFFFRNDNSREKEYGNS